MLFAGDIDNMSFESLISETVNIFLTNRRKSLNISKYIRSAYLSFLMITVLFDNINKPYRMVVMGMCPPLYITILKFLIMGVPVGKS